MSGFGYNVLGFGSGAEAAIPEVDDEFNRTSYLNHFDGANNGVNNVFDDGSASNKTVTANGNVTQGSFGPFARPDGEFGVGFDGSGDYLTLPTTLTRLTIANKDSQAATFEAFVFVKAYTANDSDDYKNASIYSKGDVYLNFAITPEGYAEFYHYDGSVRILTTSATVPLNTWTHVALTIAGGVTKIYIGGVLRATGTWYGINATGLTEASRIGLNPASGSVALNAIVSNLRLVEGTAVYTGNFTPPTSKLTAITNTKLLTCQSNRFIDNSASPLTITPVGNPAVSAFGPFLTSRVYSAGRNGASVYMDGASDYLSLSASNDFDVADGDITIECWVYRSAADTTKQCVWEFYTDDNNLLRLFYEGNKKYSLLQRVSGTDNFNVSISGTASLNEWSHLAVTRSSSGTYKLYINGVENISQAEGVTINTSGIAFYVGVDFYSTDRFWNGYICDFRIVKGSLVYSSNNFTPPTAPLTAITNTKLLLNMADGQAIDSAAHGIITLAGNANVSTDQAKFGDTSLHTDGSGDAAFVKFTNAGELNFGTGDFTLECFVRFADTDNTQVLIANWESGANTWYLAHYGGSNKLTFYPNAREFAWDPSANTWYHMALTRASGVLKAFIDGTQIGSNISETANLAGANNYMSIGGAGNAGESLNGFFDEVRVSKFARYTSNFTAPAEPFADKGQ